jgi:hypothetical protein
MQRLEGSGTPVLYIGRTVFKGEIWILLITVTAMSCSTPLTVSKYVLDDDDDYVSYKHYCPSSKQNIQQQKCPKEHSCLEIILRPTVL